MAKVLSLYPIEGKYFPSKLLPFPLGTYETSHWRNCIENHPYSLL